MACASCGSSGCGCIDSDFASPGSVAWCETLVGSLTCTVDRARDLYTRLGARSYTVALVWTRWSGGVRGEGVEEVLCRREILPTPKVSGLYSVDRVTESIGSLEEGSLSVSEISLRFTEDDLTGLTGGPGNWAAIPEDTAFYWEVTAVSAGCPAHRRFSLATPPTRDVVGFQWKIRLSRAFGDRLRNGEPE